MFPCRCLYRFADADDNVRKQVSKTDLEKNTFSLTALALRQTGEWPLKNRPTLSSIPSFRQDFGTE